jgi:FkbM family methyltransferase
MEKSFEIVSTMYGNFLINEFDYIGEHIKRRENWEPHLYEFYSQILTKDDVCVDAGANLGYHAIQFGNLSKRVYAFEPQPMVFNQLCANILFNDLNDVIIPNRLGLGEEPTTKQMWAIENEKFENGVWNWGGRGIEHEQSAYTSDEVREHDQIKVVPLDSFNFTSVNLFKMDIQGYEWYALQGAKQFLNNNKPVILLENNPTRSELDKKVLAMLSNIGYQCFRYHMDSGEDCILIHPESNKYEISLKTINTLQTKMPIKNEDISSYSI